MNFNPFEFCFFYPRDKLTGFDDCRFVAGANREDLEHSACGPQQFLVSEGPHDVDQGLGTTTGQNNQLQKTNKCTWK